jgi:hypothetical protein
MQTYPNGTVYYKYPWDGAVYVAPYTELNNGLNTYNGVLLLLAFLTGIIAVIVFGVLVYMNRENNIIRLTAVNFSYSILVGAALVFISHLFYIGRNTNSSCKLQLWLEIIGYSIIISSLIVKEARVYFILRHFNINRAWLKDSVLFFYVFLLCSVNFVRVGVLKQNLLYNLLMFPYIAFRFYSDYGPTTMTHMQFSITTRNKPSIRTLRIHTFA